MGQMIDAETNHDGVKRVCIERKGFGVAVLKLDIGVRALCEIHLRS